MPLCSRSRQLTSYVCPFLVFLLLAPWPGRPFRSAQLTAEQGWSNIGSFSKLQASHGSSRLASAQGLRASDENLGASERAGLDSLSQFEVLLELSDDFTGGRNTGGRRPGRQKGGRNGGVYVDSQSLRQQQLELYHVAGSPMVYHSFNTSQTPGGKNYLPTVRDQRNCDTCVAHAVAAAATASVASALRDDAINWDIDPQSLYYCSGGGRACRSGWQINDALFTLEENAGIIRPSRCLPRETEEPEVRDWSTPCRQAATTCPPTDMSRPWLSCRFRALSTFWQIQQSIRQYGAVVTRITIYSDFVSFFNRSQSGLDNAIYRTNPDATKLYGHAAAIVGYDNVNKAWTLLNSWGNRSTSDGLFRIAMGEAGVGAPDDTYEVVCEPRPGTDLDPHELQPWKRSQRKPVRLINPATDLVDHRTSCYYYDAVPGDTAASVADAFLIDIRRFAQDNAQVFTPVMASASFEESLTSQQVIDILTTIRNVQKLPAASEPYFQCSNTNGVVSECRLGGVVQPCTGVNNCTVFYQEPDVSIDPAGQVLQICNISTVPGQFDGVAMLNDPAVSQPRALRRLLDEWGYTDVDVPQDYCNLRAWLEFQWMRGCVDGWVTVIYAAHGVPPNVVLDRKLVDILLAFKRLERLELHVASGSIVPPQLGGIQGLRFLYLRSPCWQGQLPVNLGKGWPDIEYIDISHWARREPACGIEGRLPDLWGATMPNLRNLELRDNRLTGQLPPGYVRMTELRALILSDNQLSGSLPDSYAEWDWLERFNVGNNRMHGALPWSYGLWNHYISEFNLSSNDFQGEIPAAWSRLKMNLMDLSLSNNPRLKGCIPLARETVVRYNGTGLTGLCSNNRDVEQQQGEALAYRVQTLLSADGQQWSPVSSMMQEFAYKSVSDVWVGEDGKDVNTLRHYGKDGWVGRTLRIFNSVVYVTNLEAEGARLDPAYLPVFVPDLPRLEELHCFQCKTQQTGAADTRQLPASLAASAPPSLQSLKLEGSGLTGELPDEWGKWSTLATLSLRSNSLSGTLPSPWKAMRSLEYLDLSDNPGLTGTIPRAWTALKADILLHGTSITGCIPAQLFDKVYWNRPKVPCSQVNFEGDRLLEIRQLIDPDRQVLWTWTEENNWQGVPPGFCQRFGGVQCNRQNQVSSLDLSGLDGRVLEKEVKVLNEVLRIVANLTGLQVLKLSGNKGLFAGDRLQPEPFLQLKSLQHLDLSDCDMAGTLPQSLASAVSLQHVNLSGNPQLSGTLPELWGRLINLRVVDISGCGLSGVLPESWGTMQQLRQLMLGHNRPGVSGKLPESWGFMGNLELLDITGAQLTGPLPAVWADSAALAGRSAGGSATASQQGVAAAGVVVGSSHMTVPTRSSKVGMYKLRELRLSNNGLSGQLPGMWASLKRLQVLALSYNQFSSPLPPSWGTLQNLQVLSLANNPLASSLPMVWGGMRRIQELNLSSCRITGNLPMVWSGLRALRSLDLSNNLLTGSFPVEWGIMQDRKRYKLRSINLANNPCMDGALVQATIRQSGIRAGGRVVVNTTGIGDRISGCN